VFQVELTILAGIRYGIGDNLRRE